MGTLLMGLLASALRPLPAGAQLAAVVEIRVSAVAHEPAEAGDTEAHEAPAPRIPPPSHGPLAGAQVEVLGSPLSTFSGSDGRAVLRGLSPGFHRIRVTHIGFADQVVEVTAVNGQTTRISVELLPDPMVLAGFRVEGVRARNPAGGVVLLPEEAPATVRTVADLVETVPGVTIIRRGGPGAPATPSIRGSSGDQVLVLVDGMPVNAGLTGEADLASLELTDVARVTVIPGAASARFGAGALAGVILVETGARSPSPVEATLRGGAFGEVGGTLAASRSLDRMERWRVSGRVHQETAQGDFPHRVPEFRGGGEARRLNARSQAVRGHLALAHLGKSAEGRVRLHGERLRRGSPGTVVQPSLTGRRDEERVGASASWESGTPSEGWRVSGGLASQEARHADPSPPFGAPYRARTRIRDLNLRTEAWREVGLLSLQGGAAGSVRGVRATSLEDGVLDRIREIGVWAETSGEFGGQALPLLPNTALVRPSALIRLDLHDLVDGPVASPAIGLEVVQGGARAAIRWTHGFSPPSLADLFFQEGVLVRPNPELEPERVRGEWSLEAGWAGSLGPLRPELQGTLFQGDVDGMIIWFPDHRFIWSPSNYDVRRRGGSLTAGMRVPGVGLHLDGTLERTRVHYTGPALSGQVVYRPEWQGSLTAGWQGEYLDLRTVLRRQGARRSVAGSDLNVLEPFSTLDLGLSLPLPPVLGWGGRTDLALRNALDVRTSFLADYPLPGRWWTLSLHLSRDP